MSTRSSNTSVCLAIYSLWLRELVRFWRQRSRVFGATATPLLMWLVLGAGFGESFSRGGANGSAGYLTYFFPGIIVLTVLFSAIYSTISVIEDRKEGFLQSVVVAPIPRSAIILGKMLGGTTMAVLQGSAILVIAPFLGMKVSLASGLAGAGMLFLIAFSLTGLGLVIAWLMESTAGFHAIMNLVLMPMWLLSTAAFPIEGAHKIVGTIMRLNPLTYGVDAFRSVVYSQDPGAGGYWPVGVSAAVTVAFAALTTISAILIAGRKGETGR